MSTMSEFREFIARGNVVDLAVGVIIGGAFGKIVSSLVDQVVMPPIGWALGGIDFSKLAYVLKPDDPATATSELVAIQYGAFINTVIQFLIVAWVVFLMVKLLNAARRKHDEAPAPEAPTPTETLLVEIRDLLKPAPAAARAAVAPKISPAKPVTAKSAPAKAKPEAKAKAPARKPKT